LDTGLDREHPVTLGLLGSTGADSARWAANGSPVGVEVVLGWLAKAVAEPQPQTPAPASEPAPA
jgi:hypothetical protein